jgi:hypothetical protein
MMAKLFIVLSYSQLYLWERDEICLFCAQEKEETYPVHLALEFNGKRASKRMAESRGLLDDRDIL